MLSVKNLLLIPVLFTYYATVTSLTTERCPQQPRCLCSPITTGIKVDCSGKGFTAVPRHLPREATELILSHNPIYKLPNNSFVRVTRLRTLYIEHTPLVHMSTDTFKGLDLLDCLSLRNNTGLGIYKNRLQPEIFQHVSSLKHLLINQNSLPIEKGLQYPTEIFSHLMNLEVLAVDGVSETPLGSKKITLSNLRVVTFNGIHGTCNLTHLERDFFKYMPNVRYLELIKCNIEYIHKDAFKSLHGIFRLDLSFNEKLGFDGFEEGSKGLANSNISELILNKLYPTFGLGIELTVNNMQWLTNTNLTRIDINSNRLESIEVGVLSAIIPKTITSASVADNKLSYGLYFWQFNSVPNIQHLDVSRMFSSHLIYNILDDVDTRCKTQCKTRSVTSLVSHYHNHNNKNQRLWPVPPRLMSANASQMGLRYEISELSFQTNVVERVDLHDNILFSWKGPIYGLSKLRWLDLSNNFCTKVTDYFFDNAPSLETLLIHKNFLSYSLENDIEGNIFKNLQSLRRLNLAYNRINHLPGNIFRGLRNLSWLDLSDNRLTEFKVSIEAMPLLSHLDLRYNFLTQLPVEICKILDKLGNKTKILLEANSLECSCDTLPFVNWLMTTKVRIVSMDRLKCSLTSIGQGTRYLKDIREINTLLERSCLLYTPFILAGSGCLLLSIIAIFLMTIYRYRWKLRYFYYVSRAKYQNVGEHGDRDFIYDAFISYADEDRMFVKDELINKLETEAGLKLCIHHRDFIPGRWIQDNIAGAIYNSRKCIFLLSKEFFNSYWCQFEYNMARIEEMHSGRDILILVNLKYVPTRMIPAEIWEQMEVATYITYHQHDRNDNFWINIRAALEQ